MPKLTTIPVPSPPCKFTTTINNNPVGLRFFYNNLVPSWFMDLLDVDGNPIVCGIAVVPNTDLLSPYQHLGFGVQMFVLADNGSEAPIGFTELGTLYKVYCYAAI